MGEVSPMCRGGTGNARKHRSTLSRAISHFQRTSSDVRFNSLEHSKRGVMRGRRIVALMIAGLALAGCASTQSVSAKTHRDLVSPFYSSCAKASCVVGRAAPRGLCSVTNAVDVLVVVRAPAAATGFRFPRVTASRNVLRIRQIARFLCSLPRLHNAGKLIACPADFGISYGLQFATTSERVTPVNIDAAGCQGVAGIGGSRWLLSSPGFWPVLGAAMGLPTADQVWNGPGN